MYTRAKWEAVGPLITTLGLMVILHISPSRHSFPLEHQSGRCFYFSLVCLVGIFVLCAVHQVPWFQKHVHPVYRSSRLCRTLLPFSHGGLEMQFGKVLFFNGIIIWLSGFVRFLLIQKPEPAPPECLWWSTFHSLSRGSARDEPSPHDEKIARHEVTSLGSTAQHCYSSPLASTLHVRFEFVPTVP